MADKTEELAEMVIQAAQVFMERKLADFAKALKLSDRLAAIEAASGASEQVKSLERRASRHGDHLARIESRLQALEHGAMQTPQLLEDHRHVG